MFVCVCVLVLKLKIKLKQMTTQILSKLPDSLSFQYLGAKFTKEHFLKRNYHQVILCVSDGRTWPVKLGKRQKNMVRLQNGWITFVQDNHLEIGDVCVFALINNIKGLMDVVIFRTTEAARCNLSQGKLSINF